MNLNTFYGVLSEFCTAQTCPTMAVGPQCVNRLVSRSMWLTRIRSPGGTSCGLITTASSYDFLLLHISTSSCLGRKISSTTKQYSPQNQVSKTVRMGPARAFRISYSFFPVHASPSSRRLPSKLSGPGKANVPAAAQCFRAHISRPLPHHPPSALRATLQFALRSLPGVWSRIRPAGHEGRQGRRAVEYCVRDGTCRNWGFVGKVEGDGNPRVVIDSIPKDWLLLNHRSSGRGRVEKVKTWVGLDFVETVGFSHWLLSDSRFTSSQRSYMHISLRSSSINDLSLVKRPP